MTNTTYTLNDHNHIIDDTQTDTLAIPDTLVDTNIQHNDSSWQRDIDRLMRKLEEPPSSSVKSQTQIEETQKEEEVSGPIYLSQTGKTQQRSNKITTIPQSENIPTATTTITQRNEIAIQTENSQNLSSIHDCCQDVSTCPCVLVN